MVILSINNINFLFYWDFFFCGDFVPDYDEEMRIVEIHKTLDSRSNRPIHPKIYIIYVSYSPRVMFQSPLIR